MGVAYPSLFPCNYKDFIGQQRCAQNEITITPQRVNLKERKDDTFEVIESKQQWEDVINRR